MVQARVLAQQIKMQAKIVQQAPLLVVIVQARVLAQQERLLFLLSLWIRQIIFMNV